MQRNNVVRKLLFSGFILTLCALISSCANRDTSDWSYYNNTSSGNSTGGGENNGGNNGGGCCCCQQNNNATTCTSLISIADEQGNAVPDANVTINGDEGSTKTFISSQGGHVLAAGLTSDDYTVQVSASGYNTTSESFTVADGVCPSVELAMEAATCSAIFTVMLSGCGYSGTPWPGAIVIIDGNTYVAGPNGTVTVSLAAGTHSYNAVPNNNVDWSTLYLHCFSYYGNVTPTPSACVNMTYVVSQDQNGDPVCPQDYTMISVTSSDPYGGPGACQYL